ncbi:OsmC family protein [Halorubrum californiense DSM 19288]|uniref:OsmC family protein n=1 Tax=Halorubrum californiense DSM 19288 TaxID=1227465 RepID=M0E9X5_9EURY|nr:MULTISPECIES: OsmC family protein [Halorubrum]ELZ43863.1 OsmC family protein [Halorubrum californiense DSM 19288]TKX69302.1 OsmC family peroxiredoxin [Halorubrum sp. GN11GM_10-3_MGM]
MSEANATQRMAVSGESDSESKFVAEARGHELVMDDPEGMGGDDAGAMPVEYLLAAWSGCLNATVRATAPDFDLDVEGVAVEVAGEFNPRKHLGRDGDPRAGYQGVEASVDVDFAGDVDDEALAEFTAAVEERCPVSDNLANETATDVTLRQE